MVRKQCVNGHALYSVTRQSPGSLDQSSVNSRSLKPAATLLTLYSRVTGLSPIDMLLNNKYLTIQGAEVVTAALDHFRKRPVLGFQTASSLRLRVRPATLHSELLIVTWQSWMG